MNRSQEGTAEMITPGSIYNERFWRALESMSPQSVLDVGCGDGDLLERCQDRRIAALGVDPDPAHCEMLRDRGLDATSGRAEALPFPDRSYEWVALRVNLHQLLDLGASVREAVRVSRRGVLLAGPWFDLGIPSQALALKADLWLRKQDRRRGRINHDLFTAGDLLHYLPEDGWTQTIEHLLHISPWPEESFEKRALEAVGDLPSSDPARSELSELQRMIKRDGVTDHGMLVFKARRT